MRASRNDAAAGRGTPRSPSRPVATAADRGLSRDARGRTRRGAADACAPIARSAGSRGFLAGARHARSRAPMRRAARLSRRRRRPAAWRRARWRGGCRRCGSSSLSAQRRHPRRRPDRRARPAAARPPLPKILSERGRAADRRRRRWPGEEGVRLRCILELLYATGLRVSELVALPLAAAQRDPRFLLVRGKGGKERIVPLSEPARQALAEYLECRGRFLPTRRSVRAGCSRRAARDGHLTRQRCGQLLKELALKAGLDPARLSPHVLRHAFASHLLDQRRRSAQRAADAGPRRYRDDANLYPCAERAAAPAGRDRASACAPARSD